MTLFRTFFFLTVCLLVCVCVCVYEMFTWWCIVKLARNSKELVETPFVVQAAAMDCLGLFSFSCLCLFECCIFFNELLDLHIYAKTSL